jgi:hypothetical protein
VSVEVDVTDLFIDDYDVLLDRELTKTMESLVKKYL